MKALIVCNDHAYFLAHREIRARYLAEEGWDVIVACGGVPSNLETIGPYTLEAIDIDRWRLNIRADFRAAMQLKKLVASVEPDIIHSITVKPALLMTILKYMGFLGGAPLLMTFAGRGRLLTSEGTTANRIRQKAVLAIFRLAAKNREVFASFENDDDRNWFIVKAKMAAQRTFVTRGAGVNLEAFQPKSKTGPIKLLFAGRLLKSKGAAWFIKVASQYRNTQSAVFEMAGPLQPNDKDGLDKDVLDDSVGKGLIRYLGELPVIQMPELLARTDVVCLPTKYNEGLPRVILEAMAAGCTVIASDHPSLQGVVEDQRNGFMLSPCTFETFANAVKQAISDGKKTRAMGELASRDIRQKGVSESDVMKQFDDIYYTILNQIS